MTLSAKRIGVLIVDDSAVVRDALTRIIEGHPAMHVTGTAENPFEAAALLKTTVPDVIILDIEMPRMDGLTFLRRLMSRHPIPVVMCSTLLSDGSRALMDAMEAGAVEIIKKPQIGTQHFFAESARRVQDTIVSAASARIDRRASHRIGSPAPDRTIAARSHGYHARPQSVRPGMVIAIGASTGGTEALRHVLHRLPQACPPIVIVQHMPEHFTAAFAERLNALSALTVREARSGDTLAQGTALIAPGDKHLSLTRGGSAPRVVVDDGPLVNRHRPSVDVLFHSAAKAVGKDAVGVILTGMGNDGASGLLEMRRTGAVTIGQDETTCVVYGMPREAHALGAVQHQVPLEKIAEMIMVQCVIESARV